MWKKFSENIKPYFKTTLKYFSNFVLGRHKNKGAEFILPDKICFRSS